MVEVGDLISLQRSSRCYSDFSAFKKYRKLFNSKAYGIVVSRAIEMNGVRKFSVLFHDGFYEVDSESFDLVSKWYVGVSGDFQRNNS